MSSTHIIFLLCRRTLAGAAAGLATVAALGWPATAQAELPVWQCEGYPVIEHQNTLNLDLTASGSAAGDQSSADFNSGQSGTGNCNCGAAGSFLSLFTATSNLPNNGGWLQLNDYLEAQVFIYIYGPGNKQVPFSKIKNSGTSTCPKASNSTLSGVGTGSKGKVVFRLRKSIVGQVTYSGMLATLYWQLNYTTTPPLDMAYPFAHINANVTLTALASCQFRAGDTLTVDLGSVEKAALTVGGMPKKGFTPKSIDLGVDCSNIGTASSINYMFQSASGADGNTVLTDLRGVGIGLLDGNDKPVGLGMENTIDVPLASNSTSFFLKPYPSKLAGKAVDSGRYTGRVVVTVSLP